MQELHKLTWNNKTRRCKGEQFLYAHSFTNSF